MTLALSMSCPEGAVVVVDSARSEFAFGEVVKTQVVDDKMLFLGTRIVAVHQGASPPERGIVELSGDRGRFDVAAENIFRHFSEANYSDPKLRASGHSVIVAGVGRHGEPVRVTYFQTGRPPDTAPPEGCLFICGESVSWNGGETLLGCLHSSVKLAYRLMRKRIEAAERLGQLPDVAFPLNVAVIDPYYIQVETINEEDAAG